MLLTIIFMAAVVVAIYFAYQEKHKATEIDAEPPMETRDTSKDRPRNAEGRLAGQPHRPMTFRPDDKNPTDYGKDLNVYYDLQRQSHYHTNPHYHDYGKVHHDPAGVRFE